MNRQKAIDLVKRRLTNNELTSLDDLIIDEMDATQADVLEKDIFLPWFLLTEDASVVNIVNDPRLRLHPGFLMEDEAGALWRYDADSGEDKALKKDDYDYLKAKYPTPGTPIAYALRGNYFHLFPTPNAGFTFRTKFYKADVAPSSLAASGTNQWLTNASNWLTFRTATTIADAYLSNDKLATRLAAQADVARQSLMIRDEARKQVNTKRYAGAR